MPKRQVSPEIVAHLRRIGTDHGHALRTGYSPTFRSWRCMMARCYSPSVAHYDLYGGRGITVSSRWKMFTHFLRDMGERPVGTVLDRINPEGNYEPGNCRWATHKESSRNRRNNHLLNLDGVILTIAGWAERTGISANTLQYRFRKGWSVRKIITTPVDLSRSHGNALASRLAVEQPSPKET